MRNIQALLDLFQRRIVLADGATGTQIQALHPTADDFGGTRYEGCSEALLLHRPDLVEGIHASYLEAGADFVETNTFGATRLVLEEYGLASEVRRINLRGAQAARRAADRFSTPERPRFVAGSMGPTTCALSIGRRGVDFGFLSSCYLSQAMALHDGGVDFFLVETCQDTLNLKAALCAIRRLFEMGKAPIPIAVSATLDATGHMLGGQTPDSLAKTLQPFDLLYVGLNCGAGASFLSRHVRALAEATGARIGLMPNAGLPDADGRYVQSPEEFVREIVETCGDGVLNVVGGCCGTVPSHIRALSRALDKMVPRRAPLPRAEVCGGASFLTGIDAVEISEATRPVIAGERSNALGSKKFRELVRAGDFDGAADFARRQLDEGASLLDVAVQQPDRSEGNDMAALMEKLAPRMRAPVMVDTINPAAAEAALWCIQGKAIINSANLEGGEARFTEMVRTARRFGAALVVGLIDEKGMAVDGARKLEIARRAMAILEREGMDRSDVYLDTLVFPCASGDAGYLGAVGETVRAIGALKAAFPGVRTALGVSNVSFGLPPAVRPLVTLAFFDRCAAAGLDIAIANAAGIAAARHALAQGAYPPGLAEAVSALLDVPRSGSEKDAAQWRSLIARVADLGRSARKAAAPSEETSASPEERVIRCVAGGSREGLQEALLACLDGGMSAGKILSDVLMKGMDEVGRRFDKGELIVPEVLTCAEVLKTAIGILRPHLVESGDAAAACRGKLLLATVKGDVHDIGKNLVAMIFASSGFQVVDLGVKVEDAAIVRAAQREKPDVIGLSGLLVRSALQMVETVKALDAAGIRTPVMVGGAALSQAFADRHIAPATRSLVVYSRDAMSCLARAKAICAEGGEAQVRAEEAARRAAAASEKSAAPEATSEGAHREKTGSSAGVCASCGSGASPDFPNLPCVDGRIRQADFSPKRLYTLVNPAMLYGRHLGLKGGFLGRIDEISEDELKSLSPQAAQLRNDVRKVLDFMVSENGGAWGHPRALFRVLPARKHGNSILIQADGREARMEFPEVDGRCLSELVPTQGGQVGLFVATSLDGKILAQDFIRRGELRLAHVAQTLTLSLAEAAAEWTHGLIRELWGFGECPESFSSELRRAWLRGGYPGCRVSPGYRACPDMGLQTVLFELLEPQAIGITLTESLMMQPEASVSGIAFPVKFP